MPIRPAGPGSAQPDPGELSALSERFDGTVHLPGEDGYEAARTPWNVAVDQRPAAVALPTDASETAAIVAAAAHAGLRVAPQGTGHNPGPLGPLEDTLLLRTSAMTGVAVNPATRWARAQAGALWLEAVEASAPYQLAVLHGSSPDVGIVGYSLGGGTGWYARALGLQANSVSAVELVTADGTLVRADASTERDLFWALRGVGGNFGVVTAMEFALHEVGTPYAGLLAWDWTHAERVLRRWAEWAETAPDSVTTSFRILQLPPLPTIPEPFRGGQFAVIDGAVLADSDDAELILAPLRELRPEMDTFSRVPPVSLARLHMDPEGPTPSVSDSLMLSGLPSAAVDALLTAAGPGSGSSLLVAELRQLGGALGRPHPDAGAMPKLAGEFVFFAVAIAMSAEMAAGGQADARRAVQALSPWGCGHYLNFAEQPVDVRASYDDEVWRRLQAVRLAVDPGELFVANHRVPAAAMNPGGTPLPFS